MVVPTYCRQWLYYTNNIWIRYYYLMMCIVGVVCWFVFDCYHLPISIVKEEKKT